MKAKKARLAEGRLPYLNQDISVREVREDMLLLNKYLTDSFTKYDLDYSTYPQEIGLLEHVSRFQREIYHYQME